MKQKNLEPIAIQPPELAQRVQRNAIFAKEGERRTRYSLPDALHSSSPVGYRCREALTFEEVQNALSLLSLERPSAFTVPKEVLEKELFEESSLGILTSRQSTNYRGHKQVTFGPESSELIATKLKKLQHLEAPVLDNASYTHIILSRPYRTPFTLLLTLVGHRPFRSLFTVPLRIFRKKFFHANDIPTIGYLQQLHLGILADGMERAAVLASRGSRKAQIQVAPFCGSSRNKENKQALSELEKLCNLSIAEKAKGWSISMVAQVGEVKEEERVKLTEQLTLKIGANLMAFRSERVQPGVNAESKAPEQYQHRQDMDVPDELTAMAGRAAYNAFAHWTGCDRERAKELLLLERVDVLTPGGKERLRSIRKMLNYVTEQVIQSLPLWADLPTGKVFSRNAAKGKKAFALAGQRIYIGGISIPEVEAEGLNIEQAMRAVGAASARSSLYCELMGVLNLPDDCDLLSGICMMAGPVNQNDIGKEFYGQKDLLEKSFPDRDPTSLLVWTLKAKTISDPIGNEEQLLNKNQKGALVDLRGGPHDFIQIEKQGVIKSMRSNGKIVNEERAFEAVGNFVVDHLGTEIPGNRGCSWPVDLQNEIIWPLGSQ